MRSPPIRVRLTTWYLVVIFASLAVYSVGMYFGLRRAIEDTVDHQLQVRNDNIEQLIKDQVGNAKGRDQDNGGTKEGRKGREETEEESSLVKRGDSTTRLLPKTSGLLPGDELYQVTTASGSVPYQSPAMQDLEVPLDTGRMRNHYRHHRDEGNFTTYYHRGGDIRVLSSNVRVGSDEYRVQVATLVTPLYEVLDTFREWAWTGLPLIVCFAGVGGYWLSGRAMKPVHNLVIATQEISERNLSKRLLVPAAQDELHELAVTMNAMLNRLESAFMRITRFTSDASHELRTPIAVIRTTAEVILEKDRSAEEYKDLVGQILLESESTSALIEQLLTLARADADTAHLSLEPTDLRELVKELDPISRTLAESNGLHWSSELPTGQIVVLGDRPHLRRLLLILIDNACRYTNNGGAIRLRLDAQDQHAIIEVTDTGIGIPPEELRQIFARFFRATNARYFAPDGTGLGLSIAEWIATAHGGTLTAKSTINSGTSVSLHLRLNASEER